METYSLLREFADSWMLLGLFAFFVGVVIWVCRPGAGTVYEDPAGIPFRHEEQPAPGNRDGDKEAQRECP